MGVFIGQKFNNDVLNQINIRINKINDNGYRSPEQLIYLNSKTSWIKLTSGVNIDNSNKYAKDYQLNSTLKQQNTFGNNGTYILGNELGYRPIPGISSINVKSKGAFGSLREATINFNCWDIQQLTILELLYLRPYFPVLLEWGHTIFYDNSNKLVQNFVTLDESFLNGNIQQEQIIPNIESLRKNYGFNYDAMYGYVKNYSWNLIDNGGYECTLNIVSSGDVIESIKINTIYNEGNDYNLIKDWQRKKIFNNQNSFNQNTKLEDKLRINQEIDGNLKQVQDIRVKFEELKLVEELQTQFKGQGNGVKFDSNEYNIIKSLSSDLNEISSQLPNQTTINKKKNELEISLKNYKNNDLSTENLKIKNDFEEYIKLIEENLNKKKQKLAKTVSKELNTDSDQPESPIYLFSDILSSKLNLLLYQLYNLGTKWKQFTLKQVAKDIVFFDNNGPYYDVNCYSIHLNNKEETSLFPDYFTYIPLGLLFRMINDKLLLYEAKNNLPLISIENDPINSNTCLTHPLQVSADPSICIIPPQQEAIDLFNIKYSDLFPYNIYTISKYEANPMFIYVNVGYIAQVLHETKDDKGNVYLQQFLSELMKGIQNALGGINSFNVGFNENTNKIEINDTQQIPGSSDQNPSEIPIFGLSSITKNVSLHSEIFSDLSTMVAIGAQAGNVSSIDSTSLYLFNKEAKITNRISGKLIDDSQKSNSSIDILENTEERLKIQSTRLKNLIKYFQIQTLESFSFSSEDATANKSNLKDYLSLEKSANKNTQALNIIPLKISLTLEGISGIKIGQAFKIPNNRLPEHYRDKIAFVATSIGHNLNNNIWNTIIDAQMILLDKNRGNYEYEYLSSSENNLSPSTSMIAINNIENNLGVLNRRENFDGWDNVFPKWVPIQNGIKNIIYISSMPAKNRNGRPHHGVDIAAPIDSIIISPVDGILSIGNDPNGFGANYPKIVDTLGNTHYFGHTKKILRKNGDKIKVGEVIALVGNEGSSDGYHLHYEIRKGSTFIDPISFLNNTPKPSQAVSINPNNGFGINEKTTA